MLLSPLSYPPFSALHSSAELQRRGEVGVFFPFIPIPVQLDSYISDDHS